MEKLTFVRLLSNEQVDFYKAIFHQEADFSYRAGVFEEEKEEANYHAKFRERAVFYNATFEKRADFSQSPSSKRTFSLFHGEADYMLAKFHEIAIFSNTSAISVGGDMQISDYHSFNSGSRFLFAKFDGDVLFKWTRFNGKADFSNAEFYERAYFVENPIMENMIFTHVFLNDQGQVTFNGDLSNISFANGDITRVRFGDTVGR